MNMLKFEDDSRKGMPCLSMQYKNAAKPDKSFLLKICFTLLAIKKIL